MSDEHLDRVAYEVVGLAQLTDEQAEQARALRDLCNRAGGLDLKLGITTTSTSDTQSTEPNAFLCTLDDTLVGFCTLEGGDDPELELCGMVHPAYRRRGIGRALLRAAFDSARRRIAAIRVLVICEDASADGRAFVAAAGAKHSFSENRMETTTPPPAHAIPARLDVRPAEPTDASDLARTISESFGQADRHMADEIFRDMTVGGERYFLARLGRACPSAHSRSLSTSRKPTSMPSACCQNIGGMATDAKSSKMFCRSSLLRAG